MIFHDIKFGSKMLRGNALQAATTVTGPQSAGGFDPRNMCCSEMTWRFILIGGWQGGCHKKISRPPCLDSSTHYMRNFVPREAIPQAPESFSSQIPPVAKEVSGLYWWRSGGFGFSGPLSPWILAPHFLKPTFRNKQETRIEATKAGSRNKHVTDFNS